MNQITQQPLLTLSPQEMQALGYRVVDMLVEHFTTLPEKPVAHAHQGARDRLAAHLVEPLPENLTFRKRLTGSVDIIHFFTRDRTELERKLPGFMNSLNPGGAIWPPQRSRSS